MLCRQMWPKMSTYGLDVGNAGKKPHQRKRGKKAKRAESFVTEHVDRLQSTADVQQPVKLTIIRRNGQHEVSGGSVNPFSLVFLSDHPRLTTCTGCSKTVRTHGRRWPLSSSRWHCYYAKRVSFLARQNRNSESREGTGCLLSCKFSLCQRGTNAVSVTFIIIISQDVTFSC